MRAELVLFDVVRWRGYAEFLERVETPSVLGGWSYEVADTKLVGRQGSSSTIGAVGHARAELEAWDRGFGYVDGFVSNGVRRRGQIESLRAGRGR